MSTLTVATVKSNSSSPPAFQNTSGTEIGRLCRAFVNFNGTGTIAIRASYNVSSITDAGVGNYGVNFTNAMADANYTVVYTGGYEPGVDARVFHNINSDVAQTTTDVRINSVRHDAAQRDTDRCNVAIFR